MVDRRMVAEAMLDLEIRRARREKFDALTPVDPEACERWVLAGAPIDLRTLPSVTREA